jgi:hypothetical protein
MSEDHAQWQQRHDKRMVVVLIIAIAVGATLPFPFNIIQPVICGLSLAARVPRMIKRYHHEK